MSVQGFGVLSKQHHQRHSSDIVENSRHDELVETYFQALTFNLSASPDPPPTRPEFDVALELAYCDYLRFYCAWRRQHQRQRDRITARVVAILDKLDDGTDPGSEDAYGEAIQKYTAGISSREC